jgi:hypothetical protein
MLQEALPNGEISAMDQLQLLMTYTTFHIGLYVSLVTALLSFLTFSPKSIRRDLYPYMVLTLVCFVIAGAFGGLIASEIPRHSTYDSFRKELTPYVLEGIWGMTFETVSAIEHTFFWAGIISAVFGIVWHSREKNK